MSNIQPGIIKRVKRADFAQIHNNPLQNLKDIRSIGLLSHLLSLGDTWEIKKMQLYNKFGRAAMTHAINELEEEKLWIDIKYRDGKKNYHFYAISDIPFSDEEVLQFSENVQDAGYRILEVSTPFAHLKSSIDEKQQLKNGGGSSIDENQQLNINSSFSTVENEQLLNKNIKIQNNEIQKDKIQIDNYQGDIINPKEFKILLTDACNEFYTEFAINRWSKKDWITLVEKFVDETIKTARYVNIPKEKIRGYAYVSIKNMADHTDYKYSEEFAEYKEIMKDLSKREPIKVQNTDDDELPY